jgi:hypothetical protein
VVLYTCTDGTALGGLPGPLAHPCGKDAETLDEAGHPYQLEQVIVSWARGG